MGIAGVTWELSDPGASQQLHLPKVELALLQSGQDASCSSRKVCPRKLQHPYALGQGSSWHPQPQALVAPARQGGSSLPRCWSCSWVTFTTSICVTFSMVVGARAGCQHPVPGLQNVWKPGKPFLLSPRIFSFPSGGKTDASQCPSMPHQSLWQSAWLLSLALPAAPGIPKNGIPAAQSKTCFQQSFVLSSNSAFVREQRDLDRVSKLLRPAGRQKPSMPFQLELLGQGEGSAGGTGQDSPAKPGRG